MSGTYRIADEPRPTALSHLAVNPIWPFFSFIFGGSAISWTWYVFNGFAVGSPTRRRELAIALGGFAGNAALFILLASLLGRGLLPDGSGPYIRLVLLLSKIGFTYWLYVLQARTFSIYEYYGGKVRQGFVFVAIAFILWMWVEPSLLENLPLLYFVLS